MNAPANNENNEFNFRNCRYVVTGPDGNLFGYQFGIEYEDYEEYYRHYCIDEMGRHIEIRFNPFTPMGADDFTRWVDLGFPDTGTLSSEKLRLMVAQRMMPITIYQD